MTRTFMIFAALCIAAPVWGQSSQICVEEAAGVCLKYAPAPKAASPAQVEERRLGLSRSDRMTVQRGLRAAGVYSGGIDGAIGPRSRKAIASWQRSRGEAATGYLTAGQFAALAATAPPASAPSSGGAAASDGVWRADLAMTGGAQCKSFKIRSFAVANGELKMETRHPLDGSTQFSSAIGADGRVDDRAASLLCSSKLKGSVSGSSAKGTVSYSCEGIICDGRWTASVQ